MKNDEGLTRYASRPFPEFLSELVRQEATGVLTAMGAEAHRGIVIDDGVITAARSSLEEEKLGCFLVNRKWLDEEERKQILVSQGRADPPPFGEVLIENGFMSGSELEQELRELTLTIIRNAVTDGSAYTEFFPGAQSPHLDTLGPLSTMQVLFESARAFDDAEAKARFVGERSRRLRLVGTMDAFQADFQLTPAEAFILSRADGNPRILDIFQGSALPEEQVVSTLYTLFIGGMITVDGEDGSTSSDERTSPAPGDNELAWSDTETAERASIIQLADQAPKTDHYQALGVDRDATLETIKKAWASIRQRYGVSRSREPHLADLRTTLEAIQDRAQDAFQVLSDATTRRRYNDVLTNMDRDRKRRRGARLDRVIDTDARERLVEASLKRADELVRDGEMHSALQMLEQVCRMEPTAVSLVKLAQVQMRNPKWSDRALNSLKRALELDPASIDGWMELASFWQRQGNSERQERALAKVLQIDPEHHAALEAMKPLTERPMGSRIRSLFRRNKR